MGAVGKGMSAAHRGLNDQSGEQSGRETGTEEPDIRDEAFKADEVRPDEAWVRFVKSGGDDEPDPRFRHLAKLPFGHSLLQRQQMFDGKDISIT